MPTALAITRIVLFAITSMICLTLKTFALLVTITGLPDFASLTDFMPIRMFYSQPTNCLKRYIVRHIHFPKFSKKKNVRTFMYKLSFLQ